MTCPLFQVDSFTDTLFKGNPAAVCLLTKWLEDDILQAIAMENNLSETAFVVKKDSRKPNDVETWDLRWFTPTTEVDLCGHATLAAAHVLISEGVTNSSYLQFDTRSGRLTVENENDSLTMDFPSLLPKPMEIEHELLGALGLNSCVETLFNQDLLVVVEEEEEVLALTPDFRSLKEFPYRGVIVSAPGKHVDFVSRFFGPQVGVDEDPVTGSAHCLLTPYWAEKLGKNKLSASQISHRGGNIYCELKGDRVLLTGLAVTVMRGELELPY